MDPQGSATQDSGADAALARRLRRVHWIAGISAAAWVVLVAVCTLLVSNQIISGYLQDASDRAGRDATAMSGVVDRMFHELAAIPQVLSGNRELRAVVSRYNARGRAFTELPPEERRRELASDLDVILLGKRLTLIRNKLNYDLIYVLDANGIRVLSSAWDRPASLLGDQLEDREYFKDAMAGSAGQMFGTARTTQNPVFFFSAPIEEHGAPIGIVVVRQDTDEIGSLLASSRRTTLIVDKSGMVVATSRAAGEMADQRPAAKALREAYAQVFRSLEVKPDRPLHEAQRVIDGHSYLVTSVGLKAAPYYLLILYPIDWIVVAGRPHYIIGVLAALFGVLIVLLCHRGFSSLARRRHDEILTAALNQKLTALNLDKDRYLGIAAHDLRNPLSSMRGLSELMLEAPLEPEQQREFLETIHRTSNEMLGLVNDLLDVSVIESGKLSLRRADHDVAKLIQQRVRHLEPHARSKKISVTVDAPGVQRASIDPARFGQVVDNLVSNAIKFSPSGTAVQVALQSRDGRFAFSVQDQGPGIPDAERKLLFRSFQKLSAQPTGGEKSTGLGLAIVKKIVDAHGGTIDVESAAGSGTRFTVTTPSTPAGG